MLYFFGAEYAASKKLRDFIDSLIAAALCMIFFLIAFFFLPICFYDFYQLFKKTEASNLVLNFVILNSIFSYIFSILWLASFYLLFKIIGFIIIETLFIKGIMLIQYIMFKQEEIEKLLKISEETLGYKFLAIIICGGIFLYIIIKIIFNHPNIITLVYYVGIGFTILAIVILAIENYVEINHLYRNIIIYKYSFIKKFSIRKILIAFWASTLIILMIRYIIPLVAKAYALSLKYYINYMEARILILENKLHLIFSNNEFVQSISAFKKALFGPVRELINNFNFANYIQPFSGVLVFFLITIFSVSIIAPKFVMWNLKKSIIAVLLVPVNYFLSNFVVWALNLDIIFKSKIIPLIIVYLILAITLKIIFNEFENYFINQNIKKCGICEAYCNKTDQICRICGSELSIL